MVKTSILTKNQNCSLVVQFHKQFVIGFELDSRFGSKHFVLHNSQTVKLW